MLSIISLVVFTPHHAVSRNKFASPAGALSDTASKVLPKLIPAPIFATNLNDSRFGISFDSIEISGILYSPSYSF